MSLECYLETGRRTRFSCLPEWNTEKIGASIPGSQITITNRSYPARNERLYTRGKGPKGTDRYSAVRPPHVDHYDRSRSNAEMERFDRMDVVSCERYCRERDGDDSGNPSQHSSSKGSTPPSSVRTSPPYLETTTIGRRYYMMTEGFRRSHSGSGA